MTSLYRRTLADRERIQGPRHPDALAAREKLAGAYLAAGQLRDARKEYQRVLDGRQRTLGSGHRDTIAALYGLGSVYYARGRLPMRCNSTSRQSRATSRLRPSITPIPSQPA